MTVKAKAKTTAKETTYRIVRAVYGFDRSVKNLPKRVRMEDELIGSVTVFDNPIGSLNLEQLAGILELGLSSVTQDGDARQEVHLAGQTIATVQIHDNPLAAATLADLARLVQDEICEVVTV